MKIQLSSLRARLLLAYAGLILIGFTIVALLAGSQISTGTVQDFTQRIWGIKRSSWPGRSKTL